MVVGADRLEYASHRSIQCLGSEHGSHAVKGYILLRHRQGTSHFFRANRTLAGLLPRFELDPSPIVDLLSEHHCIRDSVCLQGAGPERLRKHGAVIGCPGGHQGCSGQEPQRRIRLLCSQRPAQAIQPLLDSAAQIRLCGDMWKYNNKPGGAVLSQHTAAAHNQGQCCGRLKLYPLRIRVICCHVPG